MKINCERKANAAQAMALRFLLACAAAALLLSCSNPFWPEDEPGAAPSGPAADIRIGDSDLDASYLRLGEKRRLRLDVYPSSAAIRTVLWVSSDPAVLSIASAPREDRSGMAVTGPVTEIVAAVRAVGVATLTATAIGGDGGEKATASVIIEVRPITVTFDTGEVWSVPSQIVSYGETVDKPDPQTRAFRYDVPGLFEKGADLRWGFAGWFNGAETETPFCFDTLITQDTILTALSNASSTGYRKRQSIVLNPCAKLSEPRFFTGF